MTPQECADVERIVQVISHLLTPSSSLTHLAARYVVQEKVAQSLPISIETVPLDKALEINNLRAVFGERYPDPVRVVSIGPTVRELLAAPESGLWEEYCAQPPPR